VKLLEGLGVTEAEIKVSEDNEWKEQRAATAGEGIVRKPACCGEKLNEKKRSLTRYNSMLYFSKAYSETRASSPVLLNTEREDSFLVNDPFYMFISILYMFRATSCSSSGESTVSIQTTSGVTLCR
jgi:hypothetical protein